MWHLDLPPADDITHMVLADALTDAIERGVLPAGARLPSRRDLAKQLKIKLGIVNHAYEIIRERNLIKGEVGRGTFVSAVLSPSASMEVSWDKSVNKAVDLAGFRSPATSLGDTIGKAMSEAVRRMNMHSTLRYPPPGGQLTHRHEGAQWLNRYGLDVSGERVVICGGAQSAMSAILSGFVRPDETVLTESLTYSGLRALCGLQGVRLLGLETDAEGLLPSALEKACAAQSGRVLFLQPTIHNPTASSMSLARRQDIARVIEKYKLLVIEDDTAASSLFDRPPALATLAPERTFYVTSLSKCISPALRLGYVVPPPAMVSRFEQALHTLSLGIPPLVPEIMSVMLGSGIADQVVQTGFTETNRRLATAKTILDGYRFDSRPGAFFLWLHVPAPWRSHEFVTAAMREGVNLREADIFKVDPANRLEAVRLSIDGGAAPEIFSTSISVVARLLKQMPSSMITNV